MSRRDEFDDRYSREAREEQNRYRKDKEPAKNNVQALLEIKRKIEETKEPYTE